MNKGKTTKPTGTPSEEEGQDAKHPTRKKRTGTDFAQVMSSKLSIAMNKQEATKGLALAKKRDESNAHDATPRQQTRNLFSPCHVAEPGPPMKE
ncbi:hypothetical protein AB6813_01340 [bacterium RCC_150]